MVDQSDNFQWQPAQHRRPIGAVVWLGTIAVCAGIGSALLLWQPGWRADSAVERKAALITPAPAPPEPGSPSSQTVRAEPTSPKFVLLNPGAVPNEDDPPAKGDAEKFVPQEQAPATTAPRKTVGPSSPTFEKRERKVLVVVRRSVPPYDRKVVRGTIVSGKLVLDRRDTRGIVVQ